MSAITKARLNCFVIHCSCNPPTRRVMAQSSPSSLVMSRIVVQSGLVILNTPSSLASLGSVTRLAQGWEGGVRVPSLGRGSTLFPMASGAGAEANFRICLRFFGFECILICRLCFFFVYFQSILCDLDSVLAHPGGF